jgi:4-hydroxythreonine-4-phosphate dehydrogenase
MEFLKNHYLYCQLKLKVIQDWVIQIIVTLDIFFDQLILQLNLQKKRKVSGIVTNPISKEILSRYRKNFTGHTEYLARLDKKKNFGMMLLNNQLKVVPFTTHIPLKDVCKHIKQKPLLEAVKLLNQSLKEKLWYKKTKNCYYRVLIHIQVMEAF